MIAVAIFVAYIVGLVCLAVYLADKADKRSFNADAAIQAVVTREGFPVPFPPCNYDGPIRRDPIASPARDAIRQQRERDGFLTIDLSSGAARNALAGIREGTAKGIPICVTDAHCAILDMGLHGLPNMPPRMARCHPDFIRVFRLWVDRPATAQLDQTLRYAYVSGPLETLESRGPGASPIRRTHRLVARFGPVHIAETSPVHRRETES